MKASDYLFSAVVSNLLVEQTSLLSYLRQIFNLMLLFITYYFLVNYIEKRPVYELSAQRAFTESIAGIFLGGIIISLIIGTLAIIGYFSIIKFNTIESLAYGLFRFGNGAFFEELLFRLIIFKLLEEYFGSWLSLLFGALLFGAAHLFNQNATLWSAIAISIGAGILLTLSFMLTRRIWLAFGLHLGWNYMQASVFGLPASGLSFRGLITPEVTGPDWITGGGFGIEASPLTVIVGLLLSGFMLKKVLMDDQVILPAWRFQVSGLRGKQGEQ